MIIITSDVLNTTRRCKAFYLYLSFYVWMWNVFISFKHFPFYLWRYFETEIKINAMCDRKNLEDMFLLEDIVAWISLSYITIYDGCGFNSQFGWVIWDFYPLKSLQLPTSTQRNGLKKGLNYIHSSLWERFDIYSSLISGRMEPAINF